MENPPALAAHGSATFVVTRVLPIAPGVFFADGGEARFEIKRDIDDDQEGVR